MTRLHRLYAALRERWVAVEPGSVWAATAVVIGAWGLIALARFGGLAIDAPRAMARRTVVGVWGWLALAIAIWLLARRQAGLGRRGVRSLQVTLAVVGIAQAPIIAVAGVVLIAAGALQVLGPGLVVAALSVAAIVPLALITGVDHVFEFGPRRAAAIVALPYLLWLATVARPSLRQVEHLL